MDAAQEHTKGERSRKRLPGKQKPAPNITSSTREAALPLYDAEMRINGQTVPDNGSFSQEDQALEPEQPAQPTAFSSVLRHILKNDHAEIGRVAREISVSEVTVHRWMSGQSEPRSNSLKKLLDALPEHRGNLTGALTQTYRHVVDSVSPSNREVQKDIYRRVLELSAMPLDDDDRLWHIMQSLFDYALLQLDPERHGLAITYAQLMPVRDDGIHSLYEWEMRGQFPWSYSLDCRVYLGSTTLAGACAAVQRMQKWNAIHEEERILFVADENEQSACAAPVMRGGRIAGVLIVSSALPDFFEEDASCQAVIEYANLLAVGLKESDFSPSALLNLVPMPDLHWQREEIRRNYRNRVSLCARKYQLSLPEADARVRCDMEEEFERLASQRLTFPDIVEEHFTL